MTKEENKPEKKDDKPEKKEDNPEVKKPTEKKEEVKQEKPENKEEKKEEIEKKEETKEKKPKKKKTSKRKKISSKKVSLARGKRKRAIARVSVSAGKGNVRVNKNSVNSINNVYLKELIMEPVKLAGEKALTVDISVSVHGGGVLGQAQASRTAIAKALVSYFDDGSLKSLYLDRDRSLLIEDSRRVESKKFKGPKARARYQKSYR